MQRADPQFKLRLPEKLKAQIELSAKNNHRSLNAEVVARLERSFDSEPEYHMAQRLLERLDALEQPMHQSASVAYEVSEMRTELKAMKAALQEALNSQGF